MKSYIARIHRLACFRPIAAIGAIRHQRPVSEKLLREMYDRLERIETAVDLRIFIEDYLQKLSRYKELEKRDVDDYLFILAGFVDSRAAEREIVDGEPLWRSVARVLIYSLDRD